MSKVYLATFVALLVGCVGNNNAPVYQGLGNRQAATVRAITAPAQNSGAIETTLRPEVSVNSSNTSPYEEIDNLPSGEDNSRGEFIGTMKEGEDVLNSEMNSQKSIEELTKMDVDEEYTIEESTQSQPEEQQEKQEKQAMRPEITPIDSKPAIVVDSKKASTKTLLEGAKAAVEEGNLDKASVLLERAHRINPNNSKILYDISQINYVQKNYLQAEAFASKAANLSKNPNLSKKIWTIIANSRKALGKMSSAEAAATKAANF